MSKTTFSLSWGGISVNTKNKLEFPELGDTTAASAFFRKPQPTMTTNKRPVDSVGACGATLEDKGNYVMTALALHRSHIYHGDMDKETMMGGKVEVATNSTGYKIKIHRHSLGWAWRREQRNRRVTIEYTEIVWQAMAETLPTLLEGWSERAADLRLKRWWDILPIDQ